MLDQSSPICTPLPCAYLCAWPGLISPACLPLQLLPLKHSLPCQLIPACWSLSADPCLLIPACLLAPQTLPAWGPPACFLACTLKASHYSTSYASAAYSALPATSHHPLDLPLHVRPFVQASAGRRCGRGPQLWAAWPWTGCWCTSGAAGAGDVQGGF